MRVHFAVGSMAATVLMASMGCSTLKMPSMPSFMSSAKKSKAAEDTKVTNAPLAPQFNTAGTQPPAAGTTASSWTNLPVYPGTSYPQTPHPAPSLAVAGAPGYGASATAPQQHAAAPPQYAAAPQNYGAMPPTVSAGTPVNPYASYPEQVAQAPPAYSPPATPAYGQPQQGAYAPPAATPPAYGAPAQQAAPPAYAQQGAPYSPPANPYAAPAGNPYAPPQTPQNAANPYGSTTR